MDVVIIVFLVLVILLVLMIPIVLFNTALARNSPFMWIVTKLFTMAEGNKLFSPVVTCWPRALPGAKRMANTGG